MHARFGQEDGMSHVSRTRVAPALAAFGAQPASPDHPIEVINAFAASGVPSQ
jgi:hypothetical protein